MSITLTDRISVRVSAKNETESNDQKKRDGGNVASALGGTNLTDSEKEELGGDLGETVTGEDGKTYARSDKVAGVLKKLKDEGKLSEPEEVHKGLDYGGIHYGFSGNPMAVGNGAEIQTYYQGNPNLKWKIVSNSPVYIFRDASGSSHSLYMFSADEIFTYVRMDIDQTNYPGHNSNMDLGKGTHRIYMDSVPSGNNEDTSPSTPYLQSLGYNGGLVWDPFMKCAYAWLFGEVETSGGAKLDPTGKTDDQIKREIEDAAAANNAVAHFSSNPAETYVAVTDENGNPMYFLGT